MNKSKYQEALDEFWEAYVTLIGMNKKTIILKNGDYEHDFIKYKKLLQELVDKFELIKAISKQKHDYYREEWLRYGEYEDKGRCSVFSQILNLIGDDEDE